MEEYNYWGDRRVIAGMLNLGKHVEENGVNYLVVDTGEEEIRLLCKWEVCDVCDGNGKHVNPSIDAGGFVPEDYEDAENYMRGVYDVTCAQCRGRRVSPVVDRTNNDKDLLERYDAHIQSEYDYAAEVAAERRMGA